MFWSNSISSKLKIVQNQNVSVIYKYMNKMLKFCVYKFNNNESNV